MSSKRIIYSQQFSSELFATGEGHRFKFRKNSYATTTLIILLFRFHYLGNLIVFSEGKVNFVHFFVTSAFLFLPVLYMFLFIGHYSKLGCLVISRIIPVAYGVGHTMLVFSVIQLVYDMAYASDALEMLYVLFDDTNLTWMNCRHDWEAGCVGLNNTEQCAKSNCFGDITQLSMFRYRVYTIRQLTMTGNQIKTDGERFWKNVEGSRIPYLLVCVMITMLITDLDVSANNKLPNIIVISYTILLCTFTLIIALNIKSPYTANLLDVFRIESETLIESKSWVTAVLYFLENMSMADVSATLIGSYLPNLAMPDLLAFMAWIGLMVLFTICEIMSCFMSAALAGNLGSSVDTMRRIDSDRENAVALVLYPQLFGSSSLLAPTISFLYFAFILVSSLFRIKLLLASIYHTVADLKPVIRAYKFYIRIFSCCFLFFLALPIYLVGLFKQFLLGLRYLEQCLGTIVLVMVTAGVLYVYGVQTLCDDYHFSYGCQPAVFFKVTLFIAPAAFVGVGMMLFITVSSLYNQRNDESTDEPKVAFYFYIIFPISIIPQVVGLLYITTYYLKRQNMAHLLRCEDNWGDPSATTRKERIIYHPRKETNYFRRIDVCKHECLRYNRLFPLIIKDEESLHRDSYRVLEPADKIYTEKEVGLADSDTRVAHQRKI